MSNSDINQAALREQGFTKSMSVPTEVLGVMKASGVISFGIVPLLVPEFDRKSVGAGSDGIFLRSVCEPLPDSLSELWSVRWSENPAGHTKCVHHYLTSKKSKTLCGFSAFLH